MGNKKNKNRKSKTKANNWRGIIRMRKPKTNLVPSEDNQGVQYSKAKSKSNTESNGDVTLSENQPKSDYCHASIEVEDVGVIDNDLFDAQFQISVAGINESASYHQSNFFVSCDLGQCIDNIDVVCVKNNEDRATQLTVSKNQPKTVSTSTPNPVSTTDSEERCEAAETTVSEHQPNITYSEEIDWFDKFIEIVEDDEILATPNQLMRVDEINNDSAIQPANSVNDLIQESEVFETLSVEDDSNTERITDTQSQLSDNEQQNVHLNNNEQHREELVGRRIVNINSLFAQIREMRHSDECHVEDMECKEEVRKGFFSKFIFKCTVCGYEAEVNSCNGRNPVNVNNSAVLGITSIGLGAYHLNELCANLEIPPLSNYLYDKTQKKQQKEWWELAKTKAFDALMEEKRLAVLNGEVDSSGNAFILMVCDGSWPKRSYSTNFSSLSGCAVIIGVRTNRVIYFDVKDKYCHVCKIAASRGTEPREHECNANYVGPSSSMETCIIIEGFQFCEKFGARFKEYISDGDSSTYKNICDLKIYQNPEQPVERDDCINHNGRNYRSAYLKLSKQKGKTNSVSNKLLTKKRGLDICTGIQTAAKHWRNSDVDLVEKLTNLERDIFNAPLHYFGVHDGCKDYFCTKETTTEAKKNVEVLKKEGQWDKLMNLIQRYFATSVPSLLLNYNNNPAESFNSLVAKLIGGKRINYCLAQSYRSRVARAVVQYNSNGSAGSTYLESKNATSTSIQALKKMEESRKRKVERNAIAKATKPKKPRFSEQVREKGVHYGKDCQRIDMSSHLFDIAKTRYLESLIDDQRNRDFIMKSTIGQKKTRLWRDMQSKILTSYYFSRIVKSRSPSSYTKLLDDIIYKQIVLNSNTGEISHQHIYEKEALRCFILVHGNNYLSECGIFIDEEHCFLGASPFRLYGENGILYVKCPLKAFKKTIDEAIATKSLNFWVLKSGVETVNKNSEWYIEIQGELHVTRRTFAFVIVWVESEFKIEKIYRDDNFWAEEMEKKLVDFYENVMVKEQVDPRKQRNMKLRVYNTQTKIFE